MERLRAGIVVLGGLHGAQRELLQWNRERIKTGRPPALLPARLCREAALGSLVPIAAGNLRRGRPGCGRIVYRPVRKSGDYKYPAELIRKRTNEG